MRFPLKKAAQLGFIQVDKGFEVQSVILRELYLKVVLSALLVVISMLAMQLSLNALKFKSLAAQAIASQMQVAGSTIESNVLRAEQIGLSIDEIFGLQDLIVREVESDPVIERIVIVSPVGAPLVSSDEEGIPAEDREAVLRRVLSVSEQESSLDRGGWLYSGRLLRDSSGATMGAVILMASTDLFIPEVGSVRERLGSNYLLVFALVAVFLIPLIFHQFRGIKGVYDLLANGRETNGNRVPTQFEEVEGLAREIELGDDVVREVSTVLDRLDAEGREVNA